MDYEKTTIERIKFASDISLSRYKKPIVCTYSGGKDSDLMLELFIRSGVPFEVHNSHTTVDAPQTVYYIREKFRQLEERGIKCHIEKPPINRSDPKKRRFNMWSLIVKKKTPPTRLARYCCAILKETSCRNRMIATGVRWDESTSRASRGAYEILGKTKKSRVILTDTDMTGESKYQQMVLPGLDTSEIMLMNDNSKRRKFIEKCDLKAKTVCNPIIEWPEHEVWNFLQSEHIETNPLYKMGFFRIGCIGCPMAGKGRYFQFKMFPTYERAYKRAFGKMLEAIKNEEAGKIQPWRNAEEVFAWWMEEEGIKGQMTIEDYYSDIE